MSAKRKTTKSASKKPAKKAARRKVAPKKAAAAPKRAAARKAAPKKPAGPQIVHWEIQSQMPERLHSFYAEAFGWAVDANNPMKYGMVSSGGEEAINGGIGGSPEAPGSRVLVYANVEDIPVILQKIESLGGRVLMPRTDVGPVIMALYSDPEGNVMGLIEG
jgi:predicted enzyme related to lactoylglutathione lyase